MTGDELFQALLERRSLQYSIDEQGLYRVQLGDTTATINLENVRRNYERDNDADAIKRFVQQIADEMFKDQPAWEEVRPFLFYSLEPSDYANGFDDILHESVTDNLVKVFVFTPSDGSRISWITHGMIADWDVNKDDLVSLANENMEQLARDTTLEVQDADGVELGMLSLTDTHFKASLILSTGFKTLVSAVHGWPVFVLAPTRDFVFVLSQSHRGFLGRLGAVVQREYNESGHPITIDVLEVSDSGITAIGTFASKNV